MGGMLLAYGGHKLINSDQTKHWTSECFSGAQGDMHGFRQLAAKSLKKNKMEEINANGQPSPIVREILQFLAAGDSKPLIEPERDCLYNRVLNMRPLKDQRNFRQAVSNTWNKSKEWCLWPGAGFGLVTLVSLDPRFMTPTMDKEAIAT